MSKSPFSRGLRTHIRKEKSRIRHAASDLQEQQRLIVALYAKFGISYENSSNNPGAQ